MSISAREDNRIYSFRDYLKMSDNERLEIIEGKIYYRAPASTRIHQNISMELSRQISNYLVDKDCKIYAAPFDVRLCNEGDTEDEITTVVQPDISVIRDLNKLDDRGCKGSPDLIIEIVSPTSSKIDNIEKLNLYEKFKVNEYWTIEPEYKIARIYDLNQNNSYGRAEIYALDETRIPVGIFKDLEIDLTIICK